MQKIIFFLFTMTILALTVPYQAQAKISEYPKLANYYLQWDISSAQAAELAKWNLLIMSPQAVERNPEILELIKKYNPQIKILAYFPSQEVTTQATNIKADNASGDIYQQVNNQNWWLRDVKGGLLNWWPKTHLIDVNNQNWQSWLPNYINDNHLKKQPLWDGVYYDNCWRDFSWLGFVTDFDNNNLADSATVADQAWIAGLDNILEKSRKIFSPEKIIVCNGGSRYKNNYDGRMFESFPLEYEGGWSANLNDYLTTGSYSIINTNNSNQPGSINRQKMRFGLTSSMLGEGYFSFDYGDQNHGQTWWFPEYKVELGQALNSAYQIDKKISSSFAEAVWQRDFSDGSVIVNSTKQTQNILIEPGLQPVSEDQILIEQSDGKLLMELLPQDGIILQKMNNTLTALTEDLITTQTEKAPDKNEVISQTINQTITPSPSATAPLKNITQTYPGLSFINGTNGSLYNDKAELLKNNQHFYDSRFPLGINLLMIDNASDSLEEVIAYNQNEVKIYSSDHKILASFYPYGAGFKQGFNLIISDLEADGHLEIITAPKTGPAHIKTFSLEGRWLNPGFFAYNQLPVGAQLATADIDQDGLPEIITAANKANLEVKFFSRLGESLSEKKFLAFEKNYHGGLQLNVADINQDQAPEIILSRQTGSNDVKIYNLFNGRLLSHWLINNQSAKNRQIKTVVSPDKLSSGILYINKKSLEPINILSTLD